MRAFWLFLTLFTAAMTQVVAQKDAILIDSVFFHQELIGAQYLTADSVNFQTASTRFDWTSHPSHRFRTGFSTDIHWLRFNVMNTTSDDQHMVVELASSSLPHASCWIRGNSLQSFEASGADLPFKVRSVRYRFIHYPFALEPGESATIYLAMQAHGANHVVPIHLRTEESMRAVRRTRLTLMTAFFSIMLTIMIFGTLILALIRTEFRWTYLAFIGSGTVTIATFLGFTFQYVWPSFPGIQQAAPYFFTHLTFLTGLLLLQLLFRTRQAYPIINRALDVMLVVFGGMALSSIFIPWFSSSLLKGWFIATQIQFITAGVIVLIAPIAFFVRNQDGEGIAFFFLVGLFMSSMIVRSFEALDVWQLATNISVWIWIGLIVMNLALALFVLRRIRKTIDDGFRIAGEVSLRKRMNMMVLLRREAGIRLEIGNEIEDRVGPLLERVEQKLESLPRKEEINVLLNQVEGAKAEIRGISENRIPGNLADMDLITALDEIMKPLEENGITITRDYPRARRIRNLDILYKQAVFRIAQGLLNNIYKHAEAKNVFIGIQLEEEFIKLNITDDGKGFEPDPEGGGKGLQIIQRRVESLGGKFLARSSQGSGTRAEVTMALKFG